MLSRLTDNMFNRTPKMIYDRSILTFFTGKSMSRKLDGLPSLTKLFICFHTHSTLKAGEEGYVKNFIIAPPGVFGRGDGPVGKAGLYMLGHYMRQGKVTYIGEGSNLCSTVSALMILSFLSDHLLSSIWVHIDDIVDLYKIVFDRALSTGEDALEDSPYDRYYTSTSGELTMKSIANAYAKALNEKGIVPSAEAARLSFEDAGPTAV